MENMHCRKQWDPGNLVLSETGLRVEAEWVFRLVWVLCCVTPATGGTRSVDWPFGYMGTCLFYWEEGKLISYWETAQWKWLGTS